VADSECGMAGLKAGPDGGASGGVCHRSARKHQSRKRTTEVAGFGGGRGEVRMAGLKAGLTTIMPE